MAFGFVVSKFDLFIHIHILHISKKSPLSEKYLGLAWVAVGVVVIGVASWYFHLNRRRLYADQPLPRSILPLFLAVLLGILGLLIFIYLLGIS